jgi:hypothetical protein
MVNTPLPQVTMRSDLAVASAPGRPVSESGQRTGLTPSQMETLLDPARYAGLCGELTERGGAQSRAIAFAIGLRVA